MFDVFDPDSRVDGAQLLTLDAARAVASSTIRSTKRISRVANTPNTSDAWPKTLLRDSSEIQKLNSKDVSSIP